MPIVYRLNNSNISKRNLTEQYFLYCLELIDQIFNLIYFCDISTEMSQRIIASVRISISVCPLADCNKLRLVMSQINSIINYPLIIKLSNKNVLKFIERILSRDWDFCNQQFRCLFQKIFSQNQFAPTACRRVLWVCVSICVFVNFNSDIIKDLATKFRKNTAHCNLTSHTILQIDWWISNDITCLYEGLCIHFTQVELFAFYSSSSMENNLL